MKTITVDALRKSLATLPHDAGAREVRIWLPGSTIAIGPAFVNDERVLIEGNVDEGSAIDKALSGDTRALLAALNNAGQAVVERIGQLRVSIAEMKRIGDEESDTIRECLEGEVKSLLAILDKFAAG